MTNLSLPSEISPKQVTDNAELPVSGPVDKVGDEDSIKPFDSHLPTEKTELGDSAVTDKDAPANDDRSLSRSRVSRHAHKGEKDGGKEEKKGDEIAGEELCSMGQLTFPPCPDLCLEVTQDR
jgi:hypothetical protein